MELPSDQAASGRTFCTEELDLLAEVLASGMLIQGARVAGASDEGREAHGRAAAIAEALDDDTLRRRTAAAARDVA